MRITGTSNVSEAAASVRKQEGRAGGGPVNRDKPYLVGEEGPEIVIPQTNGTVLTASTTRGLLGKGSHSAAQTAQKKVKSTTVGAAHSTAVEVVGNDRRLVELVRYLVRSTGLVVNAGG
jgi:SLT domain-containing protein